MSKKLYSILLTGLLAFGALNEIKAQALFCPFPAAFQINYNCQVYVSGYGFRTNYTVYLINPTNVIIGSTVANSFGQFQSPFYLCNTFQNMFPGGRVVQLVGNPASPTAAQILDPLNWECNSLVSSQVVLPVRFVSFTAKFTKENTAQLDWSVAFENNHSYYAVERSTDGRTYTEVGRQTISNYDGRNTAYYSFVDNSINTGTLYYRLKQVDKDGKFDYSKVVVLNNGIKGSINAFPNPFVKQIQIFGLNPGELNQNNVRMFNASGIQVAYKIVNNNTIEPVGALSTGIYMLRVKDQTIRLMKQ
jgi:hypothetical protein